MQHCSIALGPSLGWGNRTCAMCFTPQSLIASTPRCALQTNQLCIAAAAAASTAAAVLSLPLVTHRSLFVSCREQPEKHTQTWRQLSHRRSRAGSLPAAAHQHASAGVLCRVCCVVVHLQQRSQGVFPAAASHAPAQQQRHTPLLICLQLSSCLRTCMWGCVMQKIAVAG